jgi:nicotinamidase-related amidase
MREETKPDPEELVPQTVEATAAEIDSAMEVPEPVIEPAPEVPPARSPSLMSRHDTAILVVDFQDKLVPRISRNAVISWNIRRLLTGARVLGVMRLCTEQYPRGLGKTVPEIAELVDVDEEKREFSCRNCAKLFDRLMERGIRKILLCGIETHVCIQQTALDLLAAGFDVWLAVDACGSRLPEDHRIALRRMEAAGATLTTTESALFEWCETSEAAEFKRISDLVREEMPESGESDFGAGFPKVTPDYILQTDHESREENSGAAVTDLRFIVRRTLDGIEMARFEGSILSIRGDGSDAKSSGVTAVEMSADGATVNVQDADGKIGMVYLPVSASVSRHPRWKIRRFETFINSPEYRNDYRITHQVIEYATGNVYREFHGYEHRLGDGKCSLISGVRRIEVSRDGLWVTILSAGRSAEIISLPGEA